MTDTKFDLKSIASDPRTARGGWSPGHYFCRCRDCNKDYIGDKRSYQCSDCAYAQPEPAAVIDTDIDALAARMKDVAAKTGGDPLWPHHAFAHKHTSVFAEYEEATSPANVLRVLADRARLQAENAALRAERDATNEAAASVLKLFEVWRTRVAQAENERDCALQSRESQARNTAEFKIEADALCARVAELEAALRKISNEPHASHSAVREFARAALGATGSPSP